MSHAFALMGSGEFLPWAEPVDRWLLDSARTGSDRVVIFPVASAPEGDEVFDNWARMGIEHYRRLGASPEILPVKTRADAERTDLAEKIRGAAVVFFSGGNPGYATQVLAGTPVWRAIVDAVGDGTSFGGCSAGVSMLGDITADIAVMDDLEAIPQLDALRVFPKVYFGLHWDALDSFLPGLRAFVERKRPPDCAFFALDEDTAVTGDGSRWSVHGKGGIYVTPADGSMSSYRAGDSFEFPMLGHL